MSRPRIVVPGATVAISRRCIERKAFLGPWDGRVDGIWRYSLASAQVATGVELHHATRMLNHHHVEATSGDGRLSEFTARLHWDVSCGVKELLELEGYDGPGNLWDGRASHWMRLMDPEAMVSHLLYSRLNPVAAGLVERPGDMPGVGFDFGLWKAGARPVKRPDELRHFRHRPEELPLAYTTPGEIYLAFDGDLDAIVYHFRKQEEDAVRLFAAHRARPVIGRERLERLHPWAEPATPREGRQERVPVCKVGAGGWAGIERRRRCGRERTRFWASHEGTRQARRAGESEARYPYGTYAARVQRNEPMEEAPLPDADLAAPGLTLADARLALSRGEAGGGRTPAQILDAVRAARVEEVEETLTAERIELAGGGARAEEGARDVVGAHAAAVSGSEGAEELAREVERGGEGSGSQRRRERGGVRVQHRLDPRPDKDGGRRVVTLRDRGRRRAAPPKRRTDPGTGSSDPPE